MKGFAKDGQTHCGCCGRAFMPDQDEWDSAGVVATSCPNKECNRGSWKWHIEVAASNMIEDFAADLTGVVDRLNLCNPGARCSIARIADKTVFFEGTVSEVINEIRFRRQNPIRVTQALGEFTPAVSAAAAVMGRKGGSARSEAKTAAVRENGRKGGRPKKTE